MNEKREWGNPNSKICEWGTRMGQPQSKGMSGRVAKSSRAGVERVVPELVTAVYSSLFRFCPRSCRPSPVRTHAHAHAHAPSSSTPCSRVLSETIPEPFPKPRLLWTRSGRGVSEIGRMGVPCRPTPCRPTPCRPTCHPPRSEWDLHRVSPSVCRLVAPCTCRVLRPLLCKSADLCSIHALARHLTISRPIPRPLLPATPIRAVCILSPTTLIRLICVCKKE